MYELLKKYSEIAAPVGYEDRVQNTFIEDLKPYCKNVIKTNTGNIIAKMGGRGKKIVIFGHADEICYYVRQITDDGFLRFYGMTGTFDKLIYPYTCVGQKALILGDIKDAVGVITTKSGHILNESERSKPIEYTDLLVDIGADNKELVAIYGIRVGTPIIWNPTVERLGDKVFGKAMDDRLAHAIIIKLAEQLQGQQLNCELYFASTVMEELGLKGAADLSRGHYDVSIVLDAGICGDYPAIEAGRSQLRLGCGPGITWKDSSIHYSVEVNRELFALASKKNIPCQHALFTRYGSDSSIMVYGGSKPVLLTVPCRYTHQPHEMVNLKDLEWTANLLYYYVTQK